MEAHSIALSLADLPLNVHPAAIRGPAFSDTPNRAVVTTGGNSSRQVPMLGIG